MMAYVSVFCQVLSLFKLASASFGWHFADPIIEAMTNVCASVAAPVSTAQLAKSDKFVK